MEGGGMAAWRGDGREVFYIASGRHLILNWPALR